VNQTGVENKRFKRAQVIEALCDPKTWLFALFSALDNIPNSLTNQRQLIVASFGYSQLQVTLLGCVDGSIEIVTIATGVWLASRWPNARAWVGIVYFLPNILGAILVNVLPWHNKIGLLFSVWLTGMSMIFSSCEAIAHDPDRCGNNRIRAQPFVAERGDRGAHQESDHERDHALRVLHRQRCRPVHVAGQVQAAQPRPVGDHRRLLRRMPAAAIRGLLARENRKRDAEHAAGVTDQYDDVRVLVDDGKGELVERHVDRVSHLCHLGYQRRG
jgi:hypothetical protein